VVRLAGHPAKALLDSGSSVDLVSAALATQLNLPLTEHVEQIQMTMAVSGSRSKCNFYTTTLFEWSEIKEERVFDVLNLASYDIVLGTPFLYQHAISFCLNPARILI
ncbi:hypothetical protein K523DRAFT_218970, partial [Schizophyllum commune Tattone D]